MAAHLLAIFIVLAALSGQFLIRRLKRSSDPGVRLRTYRLIMAWQWLATVAAAWIVGPRALWYVPLDSSSASWIPGPLVTGITVVISLVAMLAPLLVAARKPRAAARLSQALGKLRFFLPQTAQERAGLVLLSITAGICEECLFRSFLLQYMHVSPWRLGLGSALTLACVIFGLGHLYQGRLGALRTCAIAGLLFLVFLGSGSLLLPIALHVVADLRLAFFLRLAEAKPA